MSAPSDAMMGLVFSLILLLFVAGGAVAGKNEDRFPRINDGLGLVEFSTPSGFFDASFELSLSHPEPDAIILFTTDGSKPHPDALDGVSYLFMDDYQAQTFRARAFRTEIFQAPITIEDRSSQPNETSLIRTNGTQDHFPRDLVPKATVVRARVWLSGVLGPVTTASYFIAEGNAFSYSLPIVSLSVNEDDFFAWEDGIYVPGRDHVDERGIPICNFGNYNRRGTEAERPVHVQYFENGNLVLDQPAGVRIHGNCSRRNAFKSLRLYARRASDQERFFTHDFFGNSVVGSQFPENHHLRRLLLRGPNFNDAVFSRLFHPVYEGVGGRIQPVKKFINGEYWGISILRDRFDAHHLEQRFGLDRDEVSIIGIRYRHEIEGGPIAFWDRVFHLSHGIPGDMDDYLSMREFVSTADVTDPAGLEQVEELLCLDSFIDHLILKIFAGDDHYAPEFSFWRVRTPQNDGLGDGRWRVFVRDFDSTLVPDNFLEGLATGTHPRPFGYEMFANLLTSERFRNRFINRFAILLNTHFLTERFDQVIHDSYTEMQAYWGAAHARWNGVVLSNPSKPFDSQRRDDLLAWSAGHPARQRGHIRSYFRISANRELSLNVSDPSHGHIRVNGMDIVPQTPGVPDQAYPWTGIFFDGIPVDLVALPEPGYRFIGWQLDGSGAISETAPMLSLAMSAAAQAEAVFEPIPLLERPVSLHVWDFEEDEEPFLLQPAFTLGGGELSVELGPDTAVEANTGGGFESQHLRVNNPLDASLIFSLPTTGYEQITLGFLTRRSGQGAALQSIAYTYDGSSWIELETYEVFNAPPQSIYFDFGDRSGVDDNPNFAVRITFERSQQQIDADGGLGGNNRFDDVILHGVPTYRVFQDRFED